MKKRIMSLVLCLVMVVSLLPTQAHAEDGAECANCGHWHYGDYMCKCGLCSIDCSNSDCWAETHCQECGECYMDVNTWCDDCGWCENCMKNDRSHCEDCGRCFVGDDRSEMCDECDKCSDCVGEICEECGRCDECAGDAHCENCPAHLEDDDECGYCKDCALTMGLHCEDCGACFEEGSAERCPVHPDGAHCEDCAGFFCEGGCNQCEYEDGIEPCPDCELCTDCCEEISKSEGCSTGEVCVESSDWDDHFCEECGECFCEKERCGYCGLCEDCCIENAEAAGCYCGNICVEDPDWAEHFEKYHGDGEIPAEHTHRYKTEWSVNETHHWHECRFCNEKSNEKEHNLTAAGKCETCGFDTKSPLFFVSQPSSLTRRVTDGNAEDPDDPNGSRKNRAVFSVSAMNLIGEELEFQWYMGSKALADEEGSISGSKTNVLNIAVPSDGCGNENEYYCVVKSKDASGNPISIESSHAALRIVHNYDELEAAEPKNGWHMVAINYTDDDGVKHENVYYATGSTEHNSFCFGSDCDHTKFKKGSNHSFVYDSYLGSGHFVSESASDLKYFYITKCSECGYKNLLYTEENSELIYNISIKDTPGAYAMNDDDVEGVTKAKNGEHIAVIAPYVNKAGNVFDHWEVVNGPEGFSDASIENYFGVGSFNMPASSIVLRGVYSTDKVPVKEVQVKGVSHTIDSKGYITVEVGETFTVTSIISPDNVVDKRVSWRINSPGIIGFIEADGTSDAESVSKKDIEGDVSLIALKPGTVLLRAISTESSNTSSNTPIQDSVFVKVVPAEGETHNYEETVVYPTCTKNGYTLHKCTDEGCGKSYQNNIQAATKHSDTDGDGLCDNVDRNTGKVCGYKMGGENTSMVGLTKIKKVELTIDAPMRGSSPATTATPTGDEKDYYSVANIAWNPDTKAFVGGTKYSVLIELEAKDKYGFKLDGIEVANTQFYINGNKATVVSKGAQEVSISYEFPATGTGSSSSGSGSGSTAYIVTVLDSKNGSVTADRKTASAGTTVTLTVSPDKGYTLDDLTVLDKNDKEIKLTEKNGKYTFTMPASNVEVEATFKAAKSGNPFVDVPSGAYYEDAVIWAVDKGVTSGTSATTFDPNGVCTRAQAVTFLWRAAGSPAPKSTTMPFTDVAQGSYYEQAVLWAVENGITKGTTETTFSPNLTCSRAQIVTFLWRSQKSPAAGSVNPFTDVSADAYYADAVLWAVKENVTSGTTATTFSPNADCTRAQIVTFIYRALAE